MIPADRLDDESYRTPGYRARTHLSDLSTAFAEDNHCAIPDPATCHGAEFPTPYTALVHGWHRCQAAAQVINARYRADWNRGGGPLTVIAPAVRDTALRELASIWDILSRNYIAATLDAGRQQWDCPFCGNPVDPTDFGRGVVDDDRCGSCCCVLWMNRAGTDWTTDWEDAG